MITKSELAVLDVLATGREASPEELAAATGYSQTYLYEVLDELVGGGLLAETRGVHNRRRVRVIAHPVVEAYRHLISKLGHVEWPELLSPATLRVCWYLDTSRRITAIADRLQITRQGVHKALTPLKNRAMLSPAGPEYALSGELQPLLSFARAVVTHHHQSRVRDVAPSATIEWCDPKRALVQVQTRDDTAAIQSAHDWQLTGLARYQEYGLQFLLAGEPAFWSAPEGSPTPAEVVCHTLVLDSGSRRVSYSMLLIEKLGLDRATLTETARWYDLEPEVSVLYRSLEGEFDTPAEAGLHPPSEAEYRALKEQYGVP